ncbi:MAG TPA: type II toxin-antitoxin system VapC family toxin [Anaerolineae bacterium]|nr:type II toxin-antitoxin system VapC family toxin [Anaerolineae bacterium]
MNLLLDTHSFLWFIAGSSQLSRPARTLIEDPTLPIQLPHVAVVTTLPFHHRDPFDRLLIAQAQIEQMPLLSGDTAFDAYAVARLW